MNDLEEAKNFFYNKNYKAAKNIFLKLNMFYEIGLCSFLLNDINDAEKFWKKSCDKNSASNWGLIVLDLIKNRTPAIKPKYFQIRAYYEIFISLLIENKLFNYAQALIDSFQYLTMYNLEVPKFIARVLHSYMYDDSALNFIDISLKEDYIDIEALYIGAQIYFERNNYSKAAEYLNLILKNAPTYYPALQLKEKIKI